MNTSGTGNILRVINKCIYCGSKILPLSNEHIIPYGLNGVHILKKASCENCANITSRIELSVLGVSFERQRILMGFRSRRKKPDNREFKTLIDGKERVLSLDNQVTSLHFPILELPAFLTGKKYVEGVNVRGIAYIPLNKPQLNSPDKVINTEEFTYEGTYFERMLAKIGLGYSVAEFGLDKFEEIFVIPSILNQKDDVGMWVGTAEDRIISNKKAVHEVEIVLKENVVTARIKLFAWFNSPEYLVVVGRLYK